MFPKAALRGKGLSTHFTRELVKVLHVPVHLHFLGGVEALKKNAVECVVVPFIWALLLFDSPSDTENT